MIIKRINNTNTIAAPLFVLHIINHPPFLSFHIILWKFLNYVITIVEINFKILFFIWKFAM